MAYKYSFTVLSSSPMICSECNQVGISKCNGCKQKYCQHERFLDEQLDWLTVDHDDLRQDISDQISTPKYHPSMAVIDKWEQEAIARIQYTAILARRAIIDALDQRAVEVNKTLNTLTPKLREARQHIKSFNENDIQEWANVLHELKQMPVFPVTVDENNNIHGLILNLGKQPRTPHSESKSQSLVTIIHDSTSPTSTSNAIESETVYTNVTKKPDVEKKTVRFHDVSSNRLRTITPGGVTIIRKQQTNEDTTLNIPQAHAEIPVDSTTR